MKKSKSIIFIGLGQMGLPMTSRLSAAGYDVHGIDLSEAAREVFEEAGGSSSGTLSNPEKDAGTIITMLPTGKIVSDAILGSGAALDSFSKGGLLIDMSSSAPADTLSLHQDLQAKGYRMIDAPVSGGVSRARDATLSIMAGGDPDDISEAHDILSAMGTVTPTGKIGSGHAMKALNNFVSASGAAAAMEAVLVGKSFGLDPEVMVDVLNQATGRNNTTEKKMKQFVLSGAYDSGFDLALMAKDIGIARDLADQLGLSMELLTGMAEMWKRADGHLGPGADHTELYRFLDEKS